MKTDILKNKVLLLVLIMGVLVPLEGICAYLAYETIGEVISSLYFWAIGLNLLFIALAFRHRNLAAIGAVLLALAIIPYQLLLGHRLIQVQAEASRIVTYVYEEKLETGRYPTTLVSYEFHNRAVEQFIQSYHVDESGGEFWLFYRVGTENTSHSYSSDLGWGYYPD